MANVRYDCMNDFLDRLIEKEQNFSMKQKIQKPVDH